MGVSENAWILARLKSMIMFFDNVNAILLSFCTINRAWAIDMQANAVINAV